jgi:hypothetical protein
MKKNKSLKELWQTIKYTNMCVTGFLKKRRKIHRKMNF